MSVFLPDLILENVMCITPQLLEERGIRAIVLDVDNTLTSHGNPEPWEGVTEWLTLMKGLGIPLMISSNNTRERVEPFASRLGVDFVPMSCKPLPIGLSRAVKRFNLPKKQVTIVGDQIFTDVLGGNLEGIQTILVKPFEEEQGRLFQLKRRFEQRFISAYYRKQ